MDTFVQDLRYGARVLCKRPGHTAVAVLTLALGIGATTAIFTVLDAVVLRPLPYRQPERLAVLWVDFGEKGQSLPSISAADFRDLRHGSRTLEGLAAGTGRTANLTGEGDPEQVDLGAVTYDFFALLGVEPAMGRSFLAEEDLPNGPDVALLSHGLWQRRFGGDPAVVGRTVQLNGEENRIAGVLPADFELLLPPEAVFLKDADVWVPLRETWEAPRNRTVLTAFARLGEGVSLAQAQREMDSFAARLREAHQVHALSDTRIRIVPLHGEVVKKVRSALVALFGAATLALLIACGNVAGLLLARTTARRREIAVRLALGASRRRIVRQLLSESVLLAVAGGALGLLLAFLGTRALLALEPAYLPRLTTVGIDRSALAFAAAACFATVLLFGVTPALRASRSGLAAAIQVAGRASTGERRSLRHLVVVGQIALSLVLLVGVGLLLRSFVFLHEVRPGFDATNVLTFRLSLPAARYGEPERAELYRQLTERLEALPGVASAGAVNRLPLGGGVSQCPYAYDEETEQNWESVTADARTVTPGFFRTLGVRLLAGRLFDEHDDADSALVVIVDDLLAGKAWPGEDAIGKRLQLPFFGPAGITREWHEVIGVIEHPRLHDLSRKVREQVWFPQDQSFARTMDVVVRTAVEPASLAAAVRQEVHAMDAELPVHALRPMDEYVTASLAQPRFTLLLSGLFGTIALLLAAVGLYGVVSQAVGQRTREFGIRLALGSREDGILRLVVGEGVRLAAFGVVVGLAAAVAAGRALSSLLYGVSATDPLTFAGVPVLMVAVALLACYFPARRATRVDPVIALRNE